MRFGVRFGVEIGARACDWDPIRACDRDPIRACDPIRALGVWLPDLPLALYLPQGLVSPHLAACRCPVMPFNNLEYLRVGSFGWFAGPVTDEGGPTCDSPTTRAGLRAEVRVRATPIKSLFMHL